MPSIPLAPDLILTGGVIHTMDPALPFASAVAVKNGRFVGVGDDREMLALAGPNTEVRSLDGRSVIPGLLDVHNHMMWTGDVLRQVQLYDARSTADIQARVAERATTTPIGEWIVGRGWDESLLAERRHPNRHDLDVVAPDHPVVIYRVWNKLVCNTKALEMAGISAETPDPPADVLYSGSFDREPDGFPAGLFRDRAKEMISSVVPEPTEEERVASIATACAAFNQVGLTAVAEPGLTPDEVHAYSRARREGRLTVRTDMMLGAWGFNPPEEETGLQERFAGIGLEAGLGDGMLRMAGIKLMPDGGISDRTAKMYEPYLDDPDNRGTWTVEPGRLVEMIRWTHDLGWPMDIHTCGDEAQQVVVKAFAAAQRENPKPWLRHRVHHAYFPTPATLRLMAEHGIPAVVSSSFLHGLAEGFVVSLGEERASRAMPMRTYLEAGVPLVGSSDSHVANYDPWVGIEAAVMRRTAAGRTLGPEEALTPEEALRSYTLTAAYAIGREDDLGSIEPGKLADLVVLDRDPLAIDPDDLSEVRPVATMVGGEWVFGGIA